MIEEEGLQRCLRVEYGLVINSFDYLPLGLDEKCATCRIVSEDGASYFLKIKSRRFYEPSCLVPQYLKDHGITSAVAPIPTATDRLWANLDELTITLFPFIEGDSSFWPGMTPQQWKNTGAAFRRIHSIPLPAVYAPMMRNETFDPTEYARGIETIWSEHVNGTAGDQAARDFRAYWVSNEPTIHLVMNALETLSHDLQIRPFPRVICHADLHPANLLRDSNANVFIIDWDDVMLAPKERDFIFVDDVLYTGTAATSSFFEGYGNPEIDWIALTYYRYERVVQDILECARKVFSVNELSLQIRKTALELFPRIIREGGEIQAAFAAADHLPAQLRPLAGRLHS